MKRDAGRREPADVKLPTYGTSIHYDSTRGPEYFRYQEVIGANSGLLDAMKFAPYVRPTDDVLDFGCGAGHLLDALHCNRKIGIEINSVAREAATNRGLTCYADMSEVPARSVDVAISNHALEHVPYPIGALREIRRALRQGGSLVLCVPIDDWRATKKYDPKDVNHHLNTWTPQLLGNTLREAGFAVDRDSIRILTHAWPPAAGKIYRLSPTAFRIVGTIWSVLRRRRQLIARVRPAPTPADGPSQTISPV